VRKLQTKTAVDPAVDLDLAIDLKQRILSAKRVALVRGKQPGRLL